MGHEGSVFEGKTLDDAVKKGLGAMGRSRAEVMITILVEGSSGFLGLGARPYKVRIMPRPGGAFRETEREPEPGRVLGSRGARGGRGRGEAGPGRGREGRGRAEAKPARGERPERGPRVSAEGARGRAPADAAPAAPRSERPATGRRDERRREGRPMRGAPPVRDPEREAEREPRRLEARGPAEGTPGRAPAGAPREEGFGPPSEGRPRRRGRRGRGTGGERPERGGDQPGAPLSEEPLREEPFHEEPFRTDPVSEETFHEESFREEPYREEPARERAPARSGSESEDERGGPRERLARATATMDQGPGLSPDELAATGKRLAEELLAAMGFEATVTASAQEDHVDVAANVASNEELLTGKKGEVRQALQHILNRMLNRGEGSRYHLQLEVNEFWKNREDELREMAQRLAEEALEGNTEAVTEYLNAQERRIVHVALKEDTRVKTYALGTGLIKRVAVAPADFPESPETD